MNSDRPAKRGYDSRLATESYQKTLKDNVSNRSFVYKVRPLCTWCKLSQDKENEFTKECTSQYFSRSRPYYDSYRGGATHYPYECPVEIQTQQPLPREERSKEIENMEEEFRAKRKILITGLPLDCNEKVSRHDFIPTIVHDK